MRISVSFTVIALGAVLAMQPQSGQAQSDRDFVFMDEYGHLVVRFVGVGASGLEASQVDEISNAEFSSMVHDRLRADLLFEQEPHDAAWAASMQPRIEEHIRLADAEFSRVYIECRAISCRLIMEQREHWSVTEHRAVLEAVQASLNTFIVGQPRAFEPEFMITAYYQESETSHIKAFLRRIESF